MSWRLHKNNQEEEGQKEFEAERKTLELMIQ